MDFHACRWPAAIPTSHDTSLAEFFDNLNEPALSNLAETLEMEQEDTGARSPLITFSHFLPLQVGLPLLPGAGHVGAKAERRLAVGAWAERCPLIDDTMVLLGAV